MSVTEKRGFFGVVADPQSYQNILYTRISFCKIQKEGAFPTVCYTSILFEIVWVQRE